MPAKAVASALRVPDRPGTQTLDWLGGRFSVRRPPPPPYSLGTAQTIISSDQTSDITGVIYPGPANKVQVRAAGEGGAEDVAGGRGGEGTPPAASHLGIPACVLFMLSSAFTLSRVPAQVEATCIIEGQHALTDVQNWPAQLQLCGPTGGKECSGISYDAADPVLIPSAC